MLPKIWDTNLYWQPFFSPKIIYFFGLLKIIIFTSEIESPLLFEIGVFPNITVCFCFFYNRINCHNHIGIQQSPQKIIIMIQKIWPHSTNQLLIQSFFESYLHHNYLSSWYVSHSFKKAYKWNRCGACLPCEEISIQTGIFIFKMNMELLSLAVQEVNFLISDNWQLGQWY